MGEQNLLGSVELLGAEEMDWAWTADQGRLDPAPSQLWSGFSTFPWERRITVCQNRLSGLQPGQLQYLLIGLRLPSKPSASR